MSKKVLKESTKRLIVELTEGEYKLLNNDL